MTKTLILIILCLFCFSTPVFSQEENSNVTLDNDINYASGKILQIVSEKGNKTLEESFHTKQITQIVKIVVLNGKYKGKIIKVENQLTASPVFDVNIKPGNRVVLSVEETPKGTEFYISDIERTPVLLIITGVFLSLLMLIGGKQGLRSIASILITGSMIFFVLVPAILNNFPVIPTTVAIALISTFITMFLVAGINIKSLSASLGTVFSVLIAGITSSLVIKFAPLNGFNTQEAAMLWANRPDLNYTELLTAGVIIASLGAVMDVGMTVASSISELKNVNNTLKTKDLFRSGLNVGKDVMGTMSSTLLLAYMGSAFSLILLASNAPLVKLLNLNSIAVEIASALSGSIGIIFCVPITAFISAYFTGKDKTNKAATSEKIDIKDMEKV